MQTPESFVCVDAPSSTGERAAAAKELAFRLREELMGSSARQSPESQPPLYRLVHGLGLGHSRSEESNDAERTSRHAERADTPPVEPKRYIALGVDDVQRLQRLAHMLATLAGELNLLLAGVQHGNEVVEP